MAGLSIVAMSLIGGGLFFGARPIARIFTSDPLTLEYATTFTKIFGISMLFFGIFFPFAGALRGAGETRIPFLARAIGSGVFMLGVSYLLALVLDWGLLGVYTGLVLNYLCWAMIAVAGFVWGDWAERASGMMKERARVE